MTKLLRNALPACWIVLCSGCSTPATIRGVKADFTQAVDGVDQTKFAQCLLDHLMLSDGSIYRFTQTTDGNGTIHIYGAVGDMQVYPYDLSIIKTPTGVVVEKRSMTNLLGAHQGAHDLPKIIDECRLR